jgi:hypothetical protein
VAAPWLNAATDAVAGADALGTEGDGELGAAAAPAQPVTSRAMTTQIAP